MYLGIRSSVSTLHMVYLLYFFFFLFLCTNKYAQRRCNKASIKISCELCIEHTPYLYNLSI